VSKPDFDFSNGIYRISWGEPEYVSIEFDLLRTDRWGNLTAEVSVWGTPEGLGSHLHTGRLDLSSTRDRMNLARYLRERSPGHQPDWAGALELACLRTIAAYRAGEPAIVLRDAQRPPDPDYLLPPLALGRLPTILFGDGGSFKSYLALAVAISVHTGQPILGLEPAATRRVAYLDWEMDAWEHRERMRALVGDPLPDLVYVACRRPLVEEIDRLRRIIPQRDIGYVVLDSVGLACDGPPEAAEVANRFFGALRQLERGSLLIAHTTKADEGERPFGSTFWHNGARLTWYARRQQEIGLAALTVGLFNRKANTGPLAAPLGFEIRFDEDRTRISRTDLRDIPELAGYLPIRVRMVHALQSGALTEAQLVDATGAKAESVRKALQRDRSKTFIKIQDSDGIGRWGLLSRAAA
jgi:hypothetical protein